MAQPGVRSILLHQTTIYGGHDLSICLHQLILKIWESEEIPADFRDAVVIVIIFNKNDRADSGNY